MASLTCVNKLKVVADDTRLAVLQLLIKGPKQVNEIHRTLNIEQSLLSHHLRTLRQAGLVTTTRDGKTIRYQLAPTVAMTEPGFDLGCCVLSF